MLTTTFGKNFSFSFVLGLLFLIHVHAGVAATQAVAGDRWINVGPTPIEGTYGIGNTFSGRVIDIAVDPVNKQHWLITTAGGIWETSDTGTTWLPRTDTLNSLAGGYLSFSSNQTVYASTGSSRHGGYAGVGIGPLRSANGGSTWQPMTTTPSFVDMNTSAISADPVNPGIVVMAVASGSGGVWKTTNATAATSTWTQVWPGRVVSDLRVSPNNFSHQIAAVGDYWSWGTTADLQEKGVYRTVTGWEPNGSGARGERLAGPWDSVGLGPIMLAIAPSDPNVVYVSVGVLETDSAAVRAAKPAVWRVDNAFCPNPACPSVTPTYTQLPLSGLDGTAVISVDPANKNNLFMGATDISRFDGVTGVWSRIGNYTDAVTGLGAAAHVDNHAIAWAGQKMILGTDGGVYASPDPLLTTFSWTNIPWQSLNRGGLSTIQFSYGTLHPSNAGAMMGGLQDNGVIQRTAGKWSMLFGGDGWRSLYSASDPDHHWASGWSLASLYRQKPDTSGALPWPGANGATQWLSASMPQGTLPDTVDPKTTPYLGKLLMVKNNVTTEASYAGIDAPIQQCPSNENIVIGGTTRVWKSSDFFSTPFTVSPTWAPLWDETSTPAGYTPIVGVDWINITTLAFSAADTTCNTFAFGTSNGQVWLTKNGGVSWGRVQDAAHPFASLIVKDVAFNPKNSDVLYAALSQWWAPSRGYLYRVNGLNTTPSVTDITPFANGKLSGYITSIVIDPYNADTATTMYVGTGNGSAGGVLWKTSNAHAAAPAWTQYAPTDGLPNASVSSLQLNENTGKLVAFTWGRGAFMLAPPIDLVSTSVGPTLITPGSVVTLNDIVCNQGYNAAAGFAVHYYLSSDALITTTDTYLGARTVIGLAGNTCDSGTISWNVSASQPQGNFYIGVIADATNVVIEGNESNNTLAQKVLISNQSDLIVSSIPPLASASAGSTVNIPFQVKNQGAGSTVQSFNANIYLLLGSSRTLLGSSTLTALAAGGIANVTFSTTLSASLGASRTYRIEVIVDEANQIVELDETNNSLQSSMFTVTTGADLTISATTGPSAASPGETISVSTTVCSGSGATDFVGVQGYLSVDTVIDAQDTEIYWVYYPSLAANTCVTASPTAANAATIPSTQAIGNYYLLVRADPFDRVPETNETNNDALARPISITRPDLIVASITPPPTTAAGSTVNIPFQVKNQSGGSTVQGFGANVYLTWYNGGGGRILLGSSTFTALAGGATVAANVTATLPSNLGASRAYVIEVFVDEAKQILEVDETNNSLSSAAFTITTGANLTITAVSAPSVLSPGEAFSVNVSVCNNGSGAAGFFGIAGHLSLDAVIDNSDSDVYWIAQNSLAANTCVTVSPSVTYPGTIPTTQAPGSYNLLSRVDDFDKVPETNENDNVWTSAMVISGIDLQVTSLSGPTSWVARNTASVSDTVCNKGTLASPSAVMNFYLSTDTSIVHGTDTLLGSRTVPALAAGQCSGPITTVVNMPTNQGTSNPYYWGGIIDPSNLITERWENNNSLAGNAVTVSGADLIVSTQTATRTSKTNNKGVTTYSLSIGNQVKNQGNASAGGFSVGYYLSTDPTYSTNDLFVCARSITSLAANALNPSTGVITTSCSFPSTTVKGTPYYVIGVADYLKAVAESNEDNNETFASPPVTLP